MNIFLFIFNTEFLLLLVIEIFRVIFIVLYVILLHITLNSTFYFKMKLFFYKYYHCSEFVYPFVLIILVDIINTKCNDNAYLNIISIGETDLPTRVTENKIFSGNYFTALTKIVTKNVKVLVSHVSGIHEYDLGKVHKDPLDPILFEKQNRKFAAEKYLQDTAVEEYDKKLIDIDTKIKEGQQIENEVVYLTEDYNKLKKFMSNDLNFAINKLPLDIRNALIKSFLENPLKIKEVEATMELIRIADNKKLRVCLKIFYGFNDHYCLYRNTNAGIAVNTLSHLGKTIEEIEKHGLEEVFPYSELSNHDMNKDPKQKQYVLPEILYRNSSVNIIQKNNFINYFKNKSVLASFVDHCNNKESFTEETILLRALRVSGVLDRY